MLEERISQLERESKLIRRAIVTAAVAGFIFGLLTIPMLSLLTGQQVIAAQVPAADVVPVLRCEELQVVDNSGNMRIQLRGGFGVPSFSMQSAQSKDVAVYLTATPSDSGALFRLTGEKTYTEYSNSGLVFRKRDKDLESKKTAAFKAYSEAPEADKNKRFEEMNTICNEIDRRTEVISLGSGTSTGGVIDVKNPFGETVVSIQSNKSNAGGVYLSDVNGNPSRFLTAP